MGGTGSPFEIHRLESELLDLRSQICLQIDDLRRMNVSEGHAEIQEGFETLRAIDNDLRRLTSHGQQTTAVVRLKKKNPAWVTWLQSKLPIFRRGQ